MSFTWLDLVLALVMLFSGFLAMLRGVTRELLSIFSWLGSLGIAAWMAMNMQDFARKNIFDHELVGPAILGVIVFLVALVVISLLTMKISDIILDSRVGAIDRTFGFLFGLVRGLALVVIVYALYALIAPEKDHPKWVTEAQSIGLLKSTGDFIVSLLPPNIFEYFPKKNRGGDSVHFIPEHENPRLAVKRLPPPRIVGRWFSPTATSSLKEGAFFPRQKEGKTV